MSAENGGERAAVTAADAARAALAAEAGGTGVAIVAYLGGPEGMARRLLVYADGTTRGTLGGPTLDEAAVAAAKRATEQGTTAESIEEADGRLLYIEVHRPPERLIVVGAGHIAVPLAHLGHEIGFHVVVLDDRQEFATSERFPAAASVLRADFLRDPFEGVAIDQDSYVVLVTRGHKWDFPCLKRLVEAGGQPRYIGMIGSRRRVRAAFLALLEAGIDRSVLARIHAPIGIDIGAETPAEIAVSIAAELIGVRRGRSTQSLADRERVLARLLPEGVE